MLLSCFLPGMKVTGMEKDTTAITAQHYLAEELYLAATF